MGINQCKLPMHTCDKNFLIKLIVKCHFSCYSERCYLTSIVLAEIVLIGKVYLKENLYKRYYHITNEIKPTQY